MSVLTPAQFSERYAEQGTRGIANEKVQQRLDAAVEQWERLACVAISPTSATCTRSGDGSAVLALPHGKVRSITSVVLDGTTLASDTYWCTPSGLLRLTSGAFTAGRQVVVTYEHGYDEPPDAVTDAILQRALELLIPSNLPGRVSSVANDLGFSRYSLAGRDGTTGIPDFDSTAALYGRDSQQFGL